MIKFPVCKINLGLHILHKRLDGFHQLESIFYPINKCDVLEVVPNPNPTNSNKLQFSAYGITIAGDPNENLVVKAYQLLDADFDLPPVSVALLKTIPMGAGLGGGSSNAAYMLQALNDMFKLNIESDQLTNYAAKLGSDCAFFLQNKPCYLHGKGHELESINFSLKGYYLILIAPGVHSNTALAYRNAKPRNTQDTTLRTLLMQPLHTWKQTIVNDFEHSVFKTFPQLQVLKQQLYDSGAIYASMSGSGSALYAIYDTDKVTLPSNLISLVIHKQWLS